MRPHAAPVRGAPFANREPMSGRDFEIPAERLPPGFAESIERVPEQPAVPRPAATIVLLRDGASGPEALLLRRVRSSGFVPGAYVFPGGRVDESDADPALVSRLDGLTPARAAERLGLHDAHPPAVAYYLAAVREAFEETGILLARSPGGSPPPTAAESAALLAERDALLADERPFAEVLDRLGLRIDGSVLEYVAHWITPLVEPRRYDTRFFAAQVPPHSEAVIHPSEMTDARWLTPEAALAACDAGDLPMVFPTIRTLEQLGGFASVREVLDAFAQRPVPAILPRLVRTPTGVGLEVEDDEQTSVEGAVEAPPSSPEGHLP
ncbi:MAG: NUDIX hydrolase [Gemmatimonadetes bacterium]|nr:MAG: NUDIX hydrolase [Gemmatimonadota bacterium]